MRNFTNFSKEAFGFTPLSNNLLSENQPAAISCRCFGKVFVAVLSIWISSTCLVFSQSSDCVPGNVQNGNDDPWSEQCYLGDDCEEQGNPCQANDVTLVGLFAADENGGPITICDTDEPVPFFLWGEFVNNANSNRYAVRTVSELYINGVFELEINQCSFDVLSPGESQVILLSELTYTCGDELALINTWVGWDSSPAQCTEPVDDNYDCCCGDYPASKCSKEIDPIAFLVPNFNFLCNGSGDNGIELCITNMSYGGLEPITYSFDFGDGYTTSLPDPCHTYEINGTVTLLLTATDANGISASASITLELEDLECCQLEFT